MKDEKVNREMSPRRHGDASRQVYTSVTRLRVYLFPCLLVYVSTSIPDFPQYSPCIPAIIGAFPIPIELPRLDIEPDHALFAGLASDNRIADEDHLPIFKLSSEIQLTP